MRGCTAIPPGYADAGVLVPIAGSPLAVAVGIGGNPRYGKLDARRAAELAVLESIAQVTAVGATPVGLTDCLNFGDPTIPEQMGAFVAAVEGLSDAARALNVPFVSGNVSLYNRSSSGNHVAPSPIVACIGTIENIANGVRGGFRRGGSTLAFIGAVPRRAAMGGSVYAEIIEMRSTTLPEIDYDTFRRACVFVRGGIAKGFILSARDVSDGGILTAATEMALASVDGNVGFGYELHHELEQAGESGFAAWFGEHVGFVVEFDDIDEARRFPDGAALIRVFGTTLFEPAAVCYEPGAEKERGRMSLAQLRESWEAPLRDFYWAAS